MKININMKKHILRDILAIGSWVMFLLVLMRSAIEPYRPFLDQMIIAGVFIIILELLSKEFEGYSARVVAMTIFTGLFYKDIPFAIFATIIAMCVIATSTKIKGTKRTAIGTVIGLAISGIAIFISEYTFSIF